MFIGDNAEVARVMGINVEATRIRLFTMHGVIAAFAGLLLTLEINVFFPTQGQGMLLPVMAAVFIGGTSIAGGQGVLVGTFFGSYIIGSLEAGVVATGIGGYWVQLVEGLVMAASVILNVVIGEEGISALSRTARKWAVPAQAPSGEGSEGPRQRMRDCARRWRAGSAIQTTKGGVALRVFTQSGRASSRRKALFLTQREDSVRKLKWVILALVLVRRSVLRPRHGPRTSSSSSTCSAAARRGTAQRWRGPTAPRAAAAANNVKLIEQYSKWDQQTMIDQFKQAMAANPDGIDIMGHPGEAAFAALVDQAEAQGIIVTSGNNPLPNIEAKYQTKGFGYAGADLYQGGYLTGQAMVKAGLKAGDKALVYDIWHQEGRSRSSQGVYDALAKAGLKVDKLDVSAAVDSDTSLAIPILTAYLQAHPDLKAIGTQHGSITAILPKVLQAAGKKPGDIICGGIDLSPATVSAIQGGWISASFDQVLYLQGYLPVLQIVLTKRYLIPGLHIDTGVGTVTPQNVGTIKPLIDQGIR